MTSARLSLSIAALALAAACNDKKPVVADKPAAPPVDKPADPPVADKTPPPADKPVAAGWRLFTSKEGNFTIDLPSDPKEQGQGGAMMAMSEFGATDADSRTSGCGIAYAPAPGGGANPEVMLDAMVKGYKANAKVLEEKDIKLGTYPGKSVVIENTSHRKWIRVYVADGKLYINNCGGPFDRGDKDAPTATRVLDSFKLTI